MKPLQRTVLETAVLVVAGTAVAFGGNALRDNRLEWTRDYFKRTPVVVPPRDVSADPAWTETKTPATPGTEAREPAAPAAAVLSAAPLVEKHLDHEFQSIDFAGVRAAVEDPRYEQGLIVVVDARADEPFEAGHIPGAVQCDHYKLDRYIDGVMEKAKVAEQVIVYCNGGPCEDSIFMCQNLLERGLAYDAVFLYEGGWKEWEQSGMPIEKGRAQP